MNFLIAVLAPVFINMIAIIMPEECSYALA